MGSEVRCKAVAAHIDIIVYEVFYMGQFYVGSEVRCKAVAADIVYKVFYMGLFYVRSKVKCSRLGWWYMV